MSRQHPTISLRAVRERFAKSNEPLLLSKFEFTAILEEVEPAMASGSQFSELKRMRTDVGFIVSLRVIDGRLNVRV